MQSMPLGSSLEKTKQLKASLNCSGRIDLPGARQLLNSGINEILDGNEDFAKGAEFCEKGNIEA